MGRAKRLALFADCSKERVLSGLKKIEGHSPNSVIYVTPRSWVKSRDAFESAAPSCKIVFPKLKHITVNDKKDMQACLFAHCLWKSSIGILIGEPTRETIAVHQVAVRMKCIRKIQVVTK